MRRGTAGRKRVGNSLVTMLTVLALAGSARAGEVHWTSWGAARTVSGSMHLVEWRDSQMLLDCGTYFSDEAAVKPESGAKVDTLNTTLPFDPKELDVVILSHAHLDHSGRIPLLVRSGWRGPIYATAGTTSLCRHMLAMTLRYGPLPEEVFYRKRGANLFHSRAGCKLLKDVKQPTRVRGSRQALSARNLRMCNECVQADLEGVMLLFSPLEYGRREEIRPGVTLSFQDAGHIAGASVTHLEFADGRRLVYSGDIGGQVELLVKPPQPPKQADTVVVESTYGGNVRSIPLPPYSDFEAALAEAAAKGEPVVVIAYTLDRTQRVLYLVRRAQEQGKIPKDWPVTMPSPSAQSATEIYERLLDSFGASYFSKALVEFARKHKLPFRPQPLHFEDDRSTRGLFIIPAGLEFSKTGQRILARLLKNPRAHIFSVGYADPASITGQVLAGTPPLIEGVKVPIEAKVRKFSVFSGHADSAEIVQWLKDVEGLRRVLVVHGEPQSNEALAQKLREALRVEVLIPERGQKLVLPE